MTRCQTLAHRPRLLLGSEPSLKQRTRSPRVPRSDVLADDSSIFSRAILESTNPIVDDKVRRLIATIRRSYSREISADASIRQGRFSIALHSRRGDSRAEDAGSRGSPPKIPAIFTRKRSRRYRARRATLGRNRPRRRLITRVFSCGGLGGRCGRSIGRNAGT